jgi:hypothetical protein
MPDSAFEQALAIQNQVRTMTSLEALKSLKTSVEVRLKQVANASFMAGDFAMCDMGRQKGVHPVYITKVSGGRNPFHAIVSVSYTHLTLPTM